MTLGFEQAGFDTLAAVDLDPVHLAAHERNFPRSEVVCADIRDISGPDLLAAANRGSTRDGQAKRKLGAIDCVFGGPSCQGFSVIGSRQADDPRNSLVTEFARVVAELQPRWFVMENVPGFVAPKYRPIRDEFYAALRTAGYEVAEPWILNARDHGVPQERKRVFVVGAREGQSLPSEPQANATPPTVDDAIGDLTQLSRFTSLYRQDALSLRQDQLDGIQRQQSEYVRRLNRVIDDPKDLSDPREWDPRLLTSVGLATHSEAVVSRFQRLKAGQRDSVGRLPKLHPGKQSPTLRAGTGRDHGSFTSARPLHHQSPRVITVREAARLHGFPDWFGFHATKWHGFRQVGNSVPPPLARAIAASVVDSAGEALDRRYEEIELGPGDLLRVTLEEGADRFGLEESKLPTNVRKANRSREAQAA